jgi:hypothetical protein
MVLVMAICNCFPRQGTPATPSREAVDRDAAPLKHQIAVAGADVRDLDGRIALLNAMVFSRSCSCLGRLTAAACARQAHLSAAYDRPRGLQILGAKKFGRSREPDCGNFEAYVTIYQVERASLPFSTAISGKRHEHQTVRDPNEERCNLRTLPC